LAVVDGVTCDQALENYIGWYREYTAHAEDRAEVMLACESIRSQGAFAGQPIGLMQVCFASRDALTNPECAALSEILRLDTLAYQRAECASNVDGIRTAEMGYDAAFVEFIAISRHPREVPDADLVVWETGNEGFEKLGWRPDGPVRGVYWVELTDDGTDFRVHGLCDVDGDGVRSHFWITKKRSWSVMETPEDVF
jgi:hypothetical protein